MVSAIGSSPSPSPAGNAKPAAGLEVQLAQYEKKLADRVDCPSFKNPEGRAKIAELSDQIIAIKQRLEAADTAASTSRPIASDAGDGSSPASLQPTGTVGSRLNVYA